MSDIDLLSNKDIKELKGVGEKTGKLFTDMGISTWQDLLTFYPRAYEVYREPVLIKNLILGEKNSVKIKVLKPVYVRRGKASVAILNVMDSTGALTISWFNMPYVQSLVKAGETYIFRGLAVKKDDKLYMEQPQIFSIEKYDQVRGNILPIYSLTKGLSNNKIISCISQVVKESDFTETLPDSIIKANMLMSRRDALHNIHLPDSFENLKKARERIVFEEFLVYFLRIGLLKASRKGKKNSFPINKDTSFEKFSDIIPFRLSNGQIKVLREIQKDFQSDFAMNRLLQGDVGSGKTIIAFLSILMMKEMGYQSCLMAPTEVLAGQHYTSLFKIFGSILKKDQVAFLTGSLSDKEKRRNYDKIQSGTAKIIIGTHAVFQKKVVYNNLGLVITDEQHRFGVNQRALLSKKGENPHVLVMSATPIPRTLGLVLYGDLDVSVLDETLKNRLPIKSCVVDTGYRKTVYKFIREEINKGRQAYVICPMIEENESLALENVTRYSRRLREIFPENINIQPLHGDMREERKNEIMADFAANKIQILVSTTVIEVGIDVANASVILIENAERFGLAQLHQLRGRVGRGEYQGYCIFMKGNSNPAIDERLNIISDSTDGFYIANEDLKLRGSGDLLGLRQSGFLQFVLGDIFRDSDILEKANKTVQRILDSDPNLEMYENRELSSILKSKESGTENII